MVATLTAGALSSEDPGAEHPATATTPEAAATDHRRNLRR
ncbi:hypothetical protein OCQ_36900 [Mycobacterium paraintracellulare]|nr:hypothetical protein OCQ_36900 [Mycobacterium paraintracellulare]